MGIYQRGRVYWIQFTDEHGERRQSTTRSRDRTVAEVIYAQELRAVELRRAGIAAASPSAGREAMGPLVDEFVEHRYADSGSVPRHVSQVRAHLHKMVEGCGFDTPARVRAETLRRYFADTEKGVGGLAYSTRRDIRSVCRLFFAYLAEVRRPPVLAFGDGGNPAELAMPRLTLRSGRIADRAGTPVERMALTADQIRTLLTGEVPPGRGNGRAKGEAGDGPAGVYADHFAHRRRVYALMLHTGYRRDVVEHLTREHIRLDAERPHIRVPGEMTKAGRTLVTPITQPIALRMIREALEVDASGGRLRVRGAVVGRPFSPVPKPVTLRRDARLLGVPTVDADGCVLDIHGLKATFLTQLFLSGASLAEVMYLGDHADPATTMRYCLKVGVTPMDRPMRGLPDYGRPAVDAGVVGRIG